MKKMQFLTLTILIMALIPGCGKQDKKAPNTPEAAFKTLVEAIRNADIEAYKKCWPEERAEREGMVSRLEKGGNAWNEIQGIFKGPQTLEDGREMERDGKQFYKAHVIAPEAEDGGIGSIMMVKEGESWKMWSW